MLKTTKIILGFVIVSMLAVGGPVMVARHYLEVAREARLEQGQPNYLAHETPPSNKKRLNTRLSAILDQDLQNIEAVPRIFLSRLPDSLPDISDVKNRKRLFISTMLPVILRSNELIRADRQTVKRLQAKISRGYLLHAREKRWVSRLFRQLMTPAERREIQAQPTIEDLDKLLYKLDIIPPSLALAQAAIESGWGTSYFAQEGNALFGQWVWDEKASGIVPRGREEGKTHRVKSFEYLLDSVRGYMRNLNRNSNYPALRKRRAELKERALPVTGKALAPALRKYSERGTAYTNDVISVIDFNGLDALDNAKLEPTTALAASGTLLAAR